MQTPKLHIGFCRLVKRAMFICTGFPQLDAKSTHQLDELLRLSREQVVEPGNGAASELRPSSAPVANKEAPAVESPPPAPGNDWYAQELNEYASCILTRDNMKSVLLFIAFNSLIVVKYAYHIILSWSEIDYRNFNKNIKPVTFGSAGEQQPEVFEFLCVLTNCTRLSSGSYGDLQSISHASNEEKLVHRLAADLKHVPILSLCHPNLMSLFAPLAGLGQLGILFCGYVGLLILCSSLGFALQQLSNRANAESLMFIVAPHVTLQLACIQLEKMRRDYTHSLENFSALPSTTDLRAKPPPPPPVGWSGGCRTCSLISVRGGGRASSIASTGDLRHKFHTYRRLFEEHKGIAVNQRSGREAASDREFVSDCLPAVRSAWWHKQIAYLYFNSFFWFVWIFCLPTAVLCLWVVFCTAQELELRLESFDKFMEADGCAIWHKLDGARIKLAGLNLGWSSWDLIETGPPVMFAVYVIIVVSVLIFAIMSELICWLREIQQNLVLLREMVHLQHTRAFLQERDLRRFYTGRSSCPSIPAGTNKSGMSMLRDLFIRHTHIGPLFIRTAPLGGDFTGGAAATTKASSDLRDKLARQQFALAMLQQADSTRLLLAELAEKIYLNHRLFVRLVDMYSTNVAASIFLEHIAAYGSTLLAVFLAKITSDIAQYARTLVVIMLMCVFTFIALISNFHAEARKLQPLFWSLIAELAHTRDIDLLHLRDLLIRQTVRIDREGGLAMCAFNFRVTYTNVIQVIAWTSTILVLAFR